MERRMEQPGLIDALVLDLGSKKLAEFFDQMEQFVPWDELGKRCGDVFDDSDATRGGRPHWPVKTMLKCQFLQACFNLSDPALEEAINDRLSFRRFLGFSLEQRSPDETTLVTFRARMIERGHGSTVFDAVVAHLNEHGLILRQGTLVDAVLIERGPGSWSRASGESAALHTRDRTAGATREKGRSTIGHKASIATDVCGTIVDFVYDSATTHETRHFDQLTTHETRAVYADKAYWGKNRMDELARRGVFPGIGIKRVRGQSELTPEQKTHNKRCASVRAAVEHPFSLLRRLGLRRLNYRGLRKNAYRFAWLATVVNLKRNLDPWLAARALTA